MHRNGSRRDLASEARGHLRLWRRHLHPRPPSPLNASAFHPPCSSLCLVHHLSPTLTTFVALHPSGATETRSGLLGLILPHFRGPEGSGRQNAPSPRLPSRAFVAPGGLGERSRRLQVQPAEPGFRVIVMPRPLGLACLSLSFVKFLSELPLHRFAWTHLDFIPLCPFLQV